MATSASWYGASADWNLPDGAVSDNRNNGVAGADGYRLTIANGGTVAAGMVSPTETNATLALSWSASLGAAAAITDHATSAEVMRSGTLSGTASAAGNSLPSLANAGDRTQKVTGGPTAGPTGGTTMPALNGSTSIGTFNRQDRARSGTAVVTANGTAQHGTRTGDGNTSGRGHIQQLNAAVSNNDTIARASGSAAASTPPGSGDTQIRRFDGIDGAAPTAASGGMLPGAADAPVQFGDPSSASSDAASGLVINLIYDANALAAPQSFRDGLQAAADLLEASIQSDITINIGVGYGEFDGFALPNQNVSEGDIAYRGIVGLGIGETYSNLLNLLGNNETSIVDTISVDALPNTTSLDGVSNFVIGSAEAKALGGLSSADPSIDGFVGIGTNFTGTTLIDGALHEITHAMGRIPGDSALSLFRYTTSGNHYFGGGPPASASYFSIDGGATALADFGENSDPSDFLNYPASDLTPNDPFDEFVAGSGSLTSVDLAIMDVLGFQVAPTSFTVSSGQTVTGTTIIYSGDTEFVQSGGTLVGLLALSGGLEVVSAGAVDSGASISSGAEQDVYGSASAASVYSGGVQVVEPGGTVQLLATIVNEGTIALAGGGSAAMLYVPGYGSATLTGGGLVSLSDNSSNDITGYGYGSAELINQDNTIRGAGRIGNDGTTDTGLTLINQSGGVIDAQGGNSLILALYGGGSQNRGVMQATSGGTLDLSADTIDNSGGLIAALDGGTVLLPDSEILGGTITAASGGVVNGGTVGGGILTVLAGGTASDTVIDSGGTAYVHGTASGTTVDAGGIEYIYGIAVGTVLSGGQDIVKAPGTTIGTIIRSGGKAYVHGVGSGTTISKGGIAYVFGVASGTVVSDGGKDIVKATGTTLDTVIDSGGKAYVHGVASGTTVSAGGVERVYSGGVASGSIVETGGHIYVLAGGEATGTTISGGSVEVKSGADVAGTVLTFAGGGRLQLDDAAQFTGQIGGFAVSDRLDLRDIGFTSGVTTVSFTEAGTGTSGTLTVGSGNASAELTLLGFYTTSNFHIRADGHGGTMVTDPPAGGAAIAATTGFTFADITGPPTVAGGGISTAPTATSPAGAGNLLPLMISAGPATGGASAFTIPA